MRHSLRRTIFASGLALALLGAAVLPSAAAARPAFSLAPRADLPGGFSLAATEAAPDAAPESPASAVPVVRKNYRRAAIEMGVVAVYATARYWAAYHDWIEDWQYELTFEDQFRRFLTTEAIRFDSNAYAVNWSHVIGGTLYYQFARTNYLSWPEATLGAFINSTLYEYVSEWREVISINDTLLTTFGGYAVGEPWFQIADYFHHSKSIPLHVLAFMNPVNELNQWLDRKEPASKVYPAPGWTGMEFAASWWHDSETGRETYDALRLGFDAQIIRTPEYGQPGTFKKTVRDTSFSELSIDVILRAYQPEDVDLKDGPFEEVDFTTRTVGLSSYSQKIDELGRGSALSIGLGSALTFVRKRPPVYDDKSVRVYLDPLPPTPTDFRDKLAVAHIAGPVVDWTHFGRGFKVRAVADAYLDFGMVHAFAFNAYSADHSIEGMKSTLGYYAYTYSYGTSASGRVDLDWGNLWVRALVSGHIWDSIDSRDRIPEDVTNNVGATDTRTRFLFKAGWRLPWAPVRAFASVESIRRWGRIGDVEASSRETRTSAGLSYLF
jgi:hypothetical protein